MRKSLFSLLGILLSFSIYAQVGNYSFRAFTASFDTIVGGTDDNLVEDDDELGNVISLGFSFDFDGTSYTHVVASSNGWLSFDTSATSSTLTNDLDRSSTAIRPLLAPLWDDLDGRASTGGPSKASYATTGSSPNRVFTYEWQRWEWNYSASNAVISFQVKLFEGSDKIEFHYRREASTPNSPSASIGLAGASTGSNNFLSLDGTGSSPNASSSVETSSLSSAPATGQVYEFSPPANRDAGISAIVGSVCAGSNDVIAVLQNYGIDTLTSASVSWTVATNSGTPATQTSASWTGSLLTGDTAHVNLGSFNFQNGNNYDLVIYSSSPNGSSDQKSFNDTLSQNGLQTGMSGTYTIGGSSPDYTTFTAAVSDLESRGVCAAVNFDVRYAAYNEQISIGAINGASATNTISFRSAAGNVAQPELYFTPSNDLYVLEFDGASYITFDDIFIESTNSSSARVISFSGENSDITIQNCHIKAPAVSSTSTNSAVIYDFSGSANKSSDITIKDNLIEGGSYGMYFYGVSTADFQDGLVITGNDIEDFYYRGVYTYYTSNVEVSENYVEDIGNYTSPNGISINYADSSEVVANNVVLNGTSSPIGIRIYFCDGSTTDPISVHNNLVSMANANMTGSPTGIYAYRGENNRVVYNTAVLQSGGTGSEAMYLDYSTTTYSIDVYNNSFVNYGQGYALYAASTTGIDTTDHNNLYSNGTNLAYWSGNRTSLAALRAFAGMETNGVNVDPNYNSPFNLKSYSVGLNNEGTPITGVTTDYEGQTRSTSAPDIGADEYTPPAKDIAVLEVLTSDVSSCGQTSQTLRAIIENAGTQNQSSIPVTLVISGGLSQTINLTYSATLNSGSKDTVTFSSFNTSAGGTLDFTVYSALSGDTVNFNDTLETGSAVVNALPTQPTTSNLTLCAGDSGQLVAQTNLQFVEWYDEETGGTLQSSNDTFQLPALTQTDTFYVEAYDMTMGSVGAADSAIGGGGNYTSMGQGLVFDVNNTITLDSVTVYPNSNGSVVVNLVNSSGATLSTRTTTVSSAGRKRIYVGFTISPGTDYELTATNTTTGGMFRNSSSAVYPYTDAGNNVRIHETNNSLGSSGYYYFFYDWAITVEGCHSERKAVIATVNPAPTVNLGADTGFCQGQNISLTLDATSANSTYRWQDNSTSPTFTANSTGQYWVEVSNNFNCVATDTLNINSFPRPQANNSVFPDYCESLAPFKLTQGGGTPSGGFGSYIGPGTQGDSLFSPAAAGAGTHSIGYIYSSGVGCSDTAFSQMTVLPKPTASLAAIPSFCANDQAVSLSQGSGTPAGGTGQYIGTGISGGSFNPASAGPGNYTVTYTYTGTNGCIDTAQGQIQVDTVPIVVLGIIPSVCENEDPVTLTQGTPSGGTYSGNGISNNQLDPSQANVGFNQVDYEFTDANGCTGSSQGSVRVDAAPDIDLGTDTTICEGSSLTLNAGIGFTTYRWDNGTINRERTVNSAGTYVVTVTNNNGCEDVDSIEVNVEICSGIDESALASIKIYPNPTSAELNIQLPKAGIALNELRVLDVNSKLLSRTVINELEMKLDLSDLASGVYFIELSGNQQQLRYKLIKE